MRGRRRVLMTRSTTVLLITILLMAGVPCAWAAPTYWNVFNIEGESSISAQIVTYAALGDMLVDTNRTGVYTPDPLGFGVNIVGSGASLVPAVPAVPIPGSLALVLTGALAMSLRRERKGHQRTSRTA
jgi:hypothetical protein